MIAVFGVTAIISKPSRSFSHCQWLVSIDDHGGASIRFPASHWSPDICWHPCLSVIRKGVTDKFLILQLNAARVVCNVLGESGSS